MSHDTVILETWYFRADREAKLWPFTFIEH